MAWCSVLSTVMIEASVLVCSTRRTRICASLSRSSKVDSIIVASCPNIWRKGDTVQEIIPLYLGAWAGDPKEPAGTLPHLPLAQHYIGGRTPALTGGPSNAR